MGSDSGGGPVNSTPQLTDEQRSLLQGQVGVLNQGRGALTSLLGTQNLLTPEIYKRLGLTPTMGNVTAPGVDNSAQIAALQKQLTSLQANRVPIWNGSGEGATQTMGYDPGTQSLIDSLTQQIGTLTAQQTQPTTTQGITGFTNTPTPGMEAFNSSVDLLNKQLKEFGDTGLGVQNDISNTIASQISQGLKGGDVPSDPWLARQIDLSEQSLRNKLQANLGTNYETSTPGIQALNEFNQQKNSLLYQNRQQNLTTMEGLNTQQLGNIFGTIGSGISSAGNASNINNANLSALIGASGFTLPTIQSLSGIAGLYNGPLSNLFTSGNQSLQASLANAQIAQNQAMGFGNLAGTALTSPMFSSITGKPTNLLGMGMNSLFGTGPLSAGGGVETGLGALFGGGGMSGTDLLSMMMMGGT